MYPEYKLVQKCLQLIEDKLNWGSSGSWHNDVFIELSDRIQQETQVLLSPTTLKRIWGKVNYPNAPSITTLNTLTQFAGYLNWRDFKNKVALRKQPAVFQTISSNLGIIMLSASIMTIVFISFYSLRGSKNTLPIDTSKVGFSSRTISSGLPNSVVFDLNLEELSTDSIRIQQYWDVTKTISLKPGQKQATGQYYYPGYFRAKLIADDQIIKEHDLFIKSDGWLATIDYDPIPKYIRSEIIRNGLLSIPESVLPEITTSDTPIISTFHNVADFSNAVSGDNFILKTAIKNTYREKWAVCQQASIYILGTKSAMIIPFSIPGCVSEIGVMMSDIYLSGKEHDLSGLGIEMSSSRELKIEVRNKQLSVYAENLKLFTRTYNESIGNIVGVRYRFLGAGEVTYLKVTNLNEKTVLIEDHFKETDLLAKGSDQ